MFTPTSIVSARRWFTPDCVTHQEPVALARDSATYDELGRRRGFRQPVPYHHRELLHVQVQHQRHIRYVNRLSVKSRFVIELVNDGQGRIGTTAISRLNTATDCEDLSFCTTRTTPTRTCTTSMTVRKHSFHPTKVYAYYATESTIITLADWYHVVAPLVVRRSAPNPP